MLGARIATAIVVLPVLLYLIFHGPLLAYRVVVLAFTGLALAEFFGMAFPEERAWRLRGVVAGMILATSMLAGAGALAAAVMALLVIGLLSTLVHPDDPAREIARIGVTAVGVLYAGALLPHLIWLREVPAGDGACWVLFILAVSMAGDTAGYFAGRFLGRRPLAPAISPKKTLEGAMGAVGGNLLAGAVVRWLCLPEVAWGEILALALFCGLLAQLGDLCESLLKRAFGAKDSGWLLPGHGGILDRMDSLVFPTVLVYYWVSVVHGGL